ncbi:TfoX N-terminal domain-containing protein [Nocardia amikacinitolerans]|nr:TfoX N-terminal domain-containing protein [Nocardia amikacinitolerans]
MAYDEELAERIREHIDPGLDVTEQKMFGGLAFLIGGNMAVSTVRDGGLLVRVDPTEAERLLDDESVTTMTMGAAKCTAGSTLPQRRSVMTPHCVSGSTAASATPAPSPPRSRSARRFRGGAVMIGRAGRGEGPRVR